MLAQRPRKRRRFTSCIWSKRNVAPPARSEAGEYLPSFKCSWRQHDLNNLLNSIGDAGHSFSSSVLTLLHNHAIHSHVGRWLIVVNCRQPNCLKFFGFSIPTVTEGNPKLMWFGSVISFRRSWKISPGRRRPKKPNEIKTLNWSHLCDSAPWTQVSLLTLAWQIIPMRSGRGNGLRRLPGCISSHAFNVPQVWLRRCLSRGRKTCTNNVPCFATRRSFLRGWPLFSWLPLLCRSLTKASRTSSTAAAFPFQIQFSSNPFSFK